MDVPLSTGQWKSCWKFGGASTTFKKMTNKIANSVVGIDMLPVAFGISCVLLSNPFHLFCVNHSQHSRLFLWLSLMCI
jgi:hypothetical protein